MKNSWLLVLISAICVSCKSQPKVIPFGNVKEINYTEVRRLFNTGLVFDKQGYQLQPEWRIKFLSNDSVMVFSPKKQRFYGFHVYFDHDSIFNMAGAWLKLKKLSTDSIVFQSLKVQDKVILDDDEGSNVYLTFYSGQYLKRKNIQVPAVLGLPGPKDTLFIKSKVKFVNTHADSAFSARDPAVLKSKSPLIKVEKVITVSDAINKIDPSMDYLLPEYNITINNAYEDFDYSFSAFIDEHGRMRFRRSVIPYASNYEKTYTDVIKGIIDGYLKLYLEITPGKTLGLAHNSIIMINLTGRKR